jgi:hypothetical protein
VGKGAAGTREEGRIGEEETDLSETEEESEKIPLSFSFSKLLDSN